MGKFTNSTAMFNSYVNLPEGTLAKHWDLPSGYVKIAVETGYFHSRISHSLHIVMFHNYVKLPEGNGIQNGFMAKIKI